MEPDVNWAEVRVIAFDLFGTVFINDRPPEEVRAYGEHIKKKPWAPLVLPKGWGELKPYKDVEPAMKKLADMDTNIEWVVSLSNAPLGVQMRLFNNRYLGFDLYIDLSYWKVFKPDKNAYVVACIECEVLPRHVLMVTANEHFGDLEGARSVGMQAILIDRERKYPKMPHDMIELVELIRGGVEREN